jgi:carbon monoxide dehydrogenase subunit G
MELTHRFTVPAGVDETWAHFNDISSVAECFPGAQVTSAEDDTFAGTVKVKLGPIALVYSGSGTFLEKDEAQHRFVVDAKGKDKRGNGTAGAKVTLSMADAAAATGTDVVVMTDLAVTGKPAQFGRGVMQDVSDKLLGQFVACLEERLGGTDTGTAAGPAAAAAAEPVVERPAPPADREEAVTSEADAATAPTPAGSPPTAPPGRVASPPRDDALDLGATVLPVLAKSYWKQALAVLIVVLLLLICRSRRSRHHGS